MPNPFKAPFGRRPQAVSINRGPYAMEMADGENAEIKMYGEVVRSHPTDWWGDPIEGDFIAQDDFLRDLDSLAQAKIITIRMDSLGGDALVGLTIHNRLRELSAKGVHLVCIVDGAAMSAASDIMCACDEVRINPASLVMIHRCWSYMWGGYNADDLRELAAEHDAYDRAAVTIYQRKTKIPEKELLRMMSETTYLTGREAVEKGFADTLLEDAEPLDIAASADGRSLLVRGRAFHLTPGMFAPDSIPTVKAEAAQDAPATVPDKTNTNQPVQTGGQNGGNIMAKTLDELRKEDPALAEQLMAEARAAVSASSAPVTPTAPPAAPAPDVDPIQAERKRIQEIDAVAALFDAATVQEAKYGENPCTAQEMAYRAAQRAAQQGGKFLADMNADCQASGAQNVPAAGDPGTPPPAEAQTPDQRMASARGSVRALFGKEGK